MLLTDGSFTSVMCVTVPDKQTHDINMTGISD